MQDTIINKEGETSTVPRELYDATVPFRINGGGDHRNYAATVKAVSTTFNLLSTLIVALVCTLGAAKDLAERMHRWDFI